MSAHDDLPGHSVCCFVTLQGGDQRQTKGNRAAGRSAGDQFAIPYESPIRQHVSAAHLALARLEAAGKLSAVITQNIDGLHQSAGSKEVLELHGSVLRNYCERCGKFYPMEHILHGSGIPRCSCGGRVKPDVVLYEESLDSSVLERSIAHSRQADMLIIGGTSLTVYPAAGLIDYYQGNKLVVINKSVTPRDKYADLVIQDSVSVLAKCV